MSEPQWRFGMFWMWSYGVGSFKLSKYLDIHEMYTVTIWSNTYSGFRIKSSIMLLRFKPWSVAANSPSLARVPASGKGLDLNFIFMFFTGIFHQKTWSPTEPRIELAFQVESFQTACNGKPLGPTRPRQMDGKVQRRHQHLGSRQCLDT